MKFSCEKQYLQEAVGIAARAAATRSPIAALEGLFIEAGEFVTITGYDLKKGIFTKFQADIVESGSIVMSCRLFGEIIRSLPDGIVTIQTDADHVCQISCGQSEFKIVGISPEDYPELPTVDYQSAVSIPQSIIKKMINETIFAVSDNESRPIYTGSLFEIENGTLTIVSVDGYRMALRQEEIQSNDMDGNQFVVPGGALRELEKICTDPDGFVLITLGSKYISFTVNETVLISHRIEGEFLDYKKSIPTEFTTEILAQRAELIHVVDRVSLLIIDDKTKNPIRCIFDSNVIRFFAVTALGKAEDICLTDGEGDGLEIGFNHRYLKEAFKAAPSETLKLCLNSSASPCIIMPPEGNSFLYMILPVRLKAGG